MSTQPAKLTCSVCDWTVDASGDAMSDRMDVVLHEAEHVDPKEVARKSRALNSHYDNWDKD